MVGSVLRLMFWFVIRSIFGFHLFVLAQDLKSLHFLTGESNKGVFVLSLR